MRLCDRCRSERSVHPTRVELGTLRTDNGVERLIPIDNASGTHDLCEGCRDLLLETLNTILAPLPRPDRKAALAESIKQLDAAGTMTKRSGREVVLVEVETWNTLTDALNQTLVEMDGKA